MEGSLVVGSGGRGANAEREASGPRLGVGGGGGGKGEGEGKANAGIRDRKKAEDSLCAHSIFIKQHGPGVRERILSPSTGRGEERRLNGTRLGEPIKASSYTRELALLRVPALSGVRSSERSCTVPRGRSPLSPPLTPSPTPHPTFALLVTRSVFEDLG